MLKKQNFTPRRRAVPYPVDKTKFNRLVIKLVGIVGTGGFVGIGGFICKLFLESAGKSVNLSGWVILTFTCAEG